MNTAESDGTDADTSVSCLVCGDEFGHYDYLMDHVVNIHRSAEVYSALCGDQNPYRDGDSE